ncbi:50S ribosomal protein L23 [Candidatus Westeberhardia cardiocondylae]|uniref:Large ribosomal subunit protein uL23 n=1 Tax=Candidatus Westeberhardia cardiocondylae TaxID=1594731 RepID=A0A0H5C4Z3_9ENTR|nr:50S ribosomal protein L23 [Candidatus Westeberhardia cardiocondylae]
MYEECLIRILRVPYFSEKSSFLMKKYNTVVFKVRKDATKIMIKKLIRKVFGIEVMNVHIINVKIKNKYSGKKKKFCRRSWKKAYIVLKKGQGLKFISNNIESL